MPDPIHRSARAGAPMFTTLCALLFSCLAVPLAAQAQIRIGVIASATGAAAALGIPEKKTVAILPATLGGKHVEYIAYDDASDSTQAVIAAHKLIDSDHVDAIIGPSTSPASLAVLDVAASSGTPMISMASSSHITAPMDSRRYWAFKSAPDEWITAEVTLRNMEAKGAKRLGYIGFSDAYGQSWEAELTRLAPQHHITLTGFERYDRADTTVTAQVLKVMSRQVDAVIVVASGTPGVLPQRALRERGFSGPIYQTYGIATPDFLRVAGSAANGTLFAISPIIVAAQLPQGNPTRTIAQEVFARYEAVNGPGSASSYIANAWDAGLLLQQAAAAVAPALQPGTPQYRAALRNGLEGIKGLQTAHGRVTMSLTDHSGYDTGAATMIEVRERQWTLADPAGL